MGSVRLPLKDELLTAMKTAETSIEAAEYLHDRFKKILSDAKLLDKSKDMLEKVDEYVKLVRFKLLTNVQPWAAESVETSSFKNMQGHIAEEVIKKFEGSTLGALKLEIAIDQVDNQTEVLRAYSSDGKGLDPEMVKPMDDLLNAWFAEKNIVNKNGNLYVVNADGKIMLDAKGNQVKADAEDIKRSLKDGPGSFEEFMRKKGFEMSVQIHKHPSQTAVEQKQETIKASIDNDIKPDEGTKAKVK